MFLDKFRVAPKGTRERIQVHERKKMNSKCEVEISILQLILCRLACTFVLFCRQRCPHLPSIQDYMTVC
jgi:hypothetical protein